VKFCRSSVPHVDSKMSCEWLIPSPVEEYRWLVPGARDPKNRIPGWQEEPVNVPESILTGRCLPAPTVACNGGKQTNRLGMPGPGFKPRMSGYETL